MRRMGVTSLHIFALRAGGCIVSFVKTGAKLHDTVLFTHIGYFLRAGC